MGKGIAVGDCMFLASLGAGAASVLESLRLNKVWAPDLPQTLTN